MSPERRGSSRAVDQESPTGADPAAGLSGNAIFKVLWDSLCDVLGLAATAALVGRAARKAEERSPELRDLTLDRLDGTYTYTLPRSFHSAGRPPAALGDLLQELLPLLFEQTGRVVVSRLESRAELSALAPLARLAGQISAEGADAPKRGTGA